MHYRPMHGLARQFLHNPRVRAQYIKSVQSDRFAGYRHASSGVNASSVSGVPIDPILNPAAPPTAPRSRSTRYLRSMITVLSFFLIGSIGGTLVGGILIPPPLPIPDSEDDSALLSKLKKDASALAIVKELRTPESKADGWIEYEAFMGLPDEIRNLNLSAGAMRGTRGIGLRRMWWNGNKKELVGVMFLGGGLAGWPGVVHGGTLATICLDAISTVGNGGPKEIRGLMSTTAAHDVDKEMVGDFRIRYLKPTNANRLFIIKAKYQDDDNETIECWLEDALSGRNTIKSTGKVGPQKAIVLDHGDSASGEGLFAKLTKTLFG